MALEIERKWVLKKLPKVAFTDVKTIIQFYYDGMRYRRETSYGGSTEEFLKIKKVNLSPGVNNEVDIEKVDSVEFYSKRNIAECEIIKKRYIYTEGDVTFEIDVFDKDLTLIMMEVELPQLDYEFNFPKEISDVILLEVTGNKNFDNFQLAK